jgi:hypothetical protein
LKQPKSCELGSLKGGYGRWCVTPLTETKKTDSQSDSSIQTSDRVELARQQVKLFCWDLTEEATWQ